MDFLIAIIDGSDVHMAAPPSEGDFSHVIKKRPFLIGCINDSRMQLELHSTPPQVSTSLSFTDIKNSIIPNLPQGTYDLVIASNELIYHIDSKHNLLVRTSYLVIGQGKDLMTGALFATNNLGMSPEDRMTIALKAASIYEYEFFRV